ADAAVPFPVTTAEGDYHLTAEQPGRVTWSEPAFGSAPAADAGADGRETSGGAGAGRDDLEWLYEERGR
ncbi:hypothetical protein, partial [Desertihabitans aurantiacus]|uniref:hypothetical protein n=1 Tax=Desertihabitans aurantiacus TaxID=2282477 RepID=UPI001E3AC853